MAAMPDDFATFLRVFKQWENQRSEGQRHIAQRPSPLRPSRPQSSQQPPRNFADFSSFLQALDEVKKRQDEIYLALNALQNMAEQIKKTVDDGVATMVGTMERFEVIGRGVLEMALHTNTQPNERPQPSAPSQLNQHSSSTPQRTALFTAPSNPTQPHYAQPASQPPESFGGDNFMDYDLTAFLGSENSH